MQRSEVCSTSPTNPPLLPGALGEPPHCCPSPPSPPSPQTPKAQRDCHFPPSPLCSVGRFRHPDKGSLLGRRRRRSKQGEEEERKRRRRRVEEGEVAKEDQRQTRERLAAYFRLIDTKQHLAFQGFLYGEGREKGAFLLGHTHIRN